ncbi:MAG: PorV/PorQ family protein [Fidelibacterota bacterium]
MPVIKSIRKIVILFAILGFSTVLMAQFTEDEYIESVYKEDVMKRGTSAAPFLEIGVGAKAQAMGGAFTAIANDASALFWNPAGITQIQTISASVIYTEWLANTRHEYFGAVIPLGGRFAWGLNATILDYVDEQPVRTIDQPEGTGEYWTASDMALATSFAARITDRFSFGMSAKYIRMQIWNETASAGALDFGVLYKSQLKGLTLGTSISNFGTTLKLDGRDLVRAYDADKQHYSNDQLNVLYKMESYPLPLLFRFGIAYSITRSKNQLTLTCDLNHPSNDIESINVGLEYCLLNIFYLRTGYQSLFDDDSENGLTYGFGLETPLKNSFGLAFSYSFAEWGLLENVQRFSVDLKM